MSKKIKKEVKKSKEEELDEEEEDTPIDNTDDDNDEEADDEEAGDESDDDDSEDDDDDGDGSSTKIDYKKIAEDERKKRETAEALIAGDKFRNKKNKGHADEDEDDDDGDKPLTMKDLQKVLATQNQQSQKTLYRDRIKDIAYDMAESDDEAEAIIAVHANRIWPDNLSIKEQIEETHAIVNRKRFTSKISELKRAKNSKINLSTGGDNAFRDGQRGNVPKMSKADESAYKAAGFNFDVKNRVYKKKLPNGKFLVKDPKTKKTWVL